MLNKTETINALPQADTAPPPGSNLRQPLAHDSGQKHVTGSARYIDDIPEPAGILHVYIAMSEIAHGTLTTLNLDSVRSAPGVAAVLTSDDIPGKNDVSPVAGDDPLFTPGPIEYWGQALFAVAAESLDQARAAAQKAIIEYAALPAILTIDQAMEQGSFLGPAYKMEIGTPEDAIKSAPQRAKNRIYIGGQEHFYLEGQAALAVPGEEDEITLYSSTQHPSEIQHTIAKVLGRAHHQIRVEVRRMGGGFGGKESQGNLPAAVAALTAHKTGRAAKVVYDRDDDMTITGKRHDFRIDYEVGFDEEGRILGLIFDQALRCGMSWDLSEPIADRAMFHADNCYYLPHARILSHRCKTHTQSNTAFRGFGGPQGMVGIEHVITHIAHSLSLDPLLVRQRNFYAPMEIVDTALSELKEKGSAQPLPASAAPARSLTPYHMIVEDCIIADMVAELAQKADYGTRRVEIAQWNTVNPLLKRGIALTPVKFGISFTKSFLNQAGALIHIYNDGSIHLNHGGTEMGQGLFTKVAQVVSEVFGVNINRIKITATDTDKVPNTSATAASSGSDLNGMAAKNAAETIKARLIDFLCTQHQAKPETIRFENEKIHIGQEAHSFEDVIMAAYQNRISLSSTGFYATPKIHWDQASATGQPFYYFSYGAAISEVLIDTLTGENKILRTDILHDVGHSLNPALDLGQIEGGYIQGAGWLTTEELVWNDMGKLMTHAPSTYKIPACSDRPEHFNIALWQSGDDKAQNKEKTIYRSKAVGEPPLMLAISVLMALQDAVSAATDGMAKSAYCALNAPATPERILLAIEDAKQNAAQKGGAHG